MGEPWFGVKRYGIGIGPRSPAGWAATVLFMVVVVVVPQVVVALHGPPWATLAIVLALGAAFTLLAFAKSDRKPWRWRWGGRD
ncbi:MAG: hypothetical protein INR64_20245 [Caulobacteraceae bacterium]|nr:hypothetical protein [Caulobacter sp.]